MYRRGLALFLTAVLLLSNGSFAAELLPEEFSIYDATLKSLESTAGELRRSTYGNKYNLILGPEEESFALRAVPTESDPALGPDLTIDGEIAGYGQNSQAFSLKPGERREVEILVTPQQGSKAEYKVFAYRTPTLVEARGTISEPWADGSRQLALEFRIPAGTDFKVLMLALAFDSAQLQLCKPATNEPSTTLGYVTAFPKGFLYQGGTGVFQTLSGSKGDNKTGRLLLQFGVHSESAQESYVVQPGNETVLTAYFRLAAEGAVTAESLHLEAQSSAVHGGFSLTERGTDGQYVEGVSYPGMVEFTGTQRELALWADRVEGGALVRSPVKARYGFGETVTLSAVADEGWRFTRWTVDSAGPEVPSELDLTQRELKVRLLADVDLTALRPEFEHLDEALLSGRGLDFTAPFGGEAVVVVNPAYGSAQTVGGEFQSVSKSESENIREDALELSGAQELIWSEFEETLDGGERVATPSQRSEPEAKEGNQRTFQVRDTRVSDSGKPEAWAGAPFTLRQVRQAGEKRLNLWLCDDPDWQPMSLTEEQLGELADSFTQSMTVIETDFHPLTDTNGNGALDLLLYDIRDGYNDGGMTYNAGFFSQYEFYGVLGPDSTYGVGNFGDVLHLDTWPLLSQSFTPTEEGLERLKSTMAHEAQHMALASSYATGAEYSKAPKWINEGLSMTAEHTLFGLQDSRIATFNRMRDGHSLTQWSSSASADVVENYALSYLFFQYVKNQAEQANFVGGFYRSYSGGEKAAVLETLQSFPVFRDKSFDEILASFYLALYLKEESGPYGFATENELFAGAVPFVKKDLPDEALPSGGAVYMESPGQFTPSGGSALRIASVSTPIHQLTVEPPEGGTVQVAEGKYSYLHGEHASLTAVPAAGYTFNGWTGDAAGLDNPLDLTMDEAKTVSALFEPIPRYALTVACGEGGKVIAKDGEGALLSDLSALYAGTLVTLTAMPDGKSVFTGWAGAVTDKNATVTLTVEQDMTVEATFRTAQPLPPEALLEVPEGATLSAKPGENKIYLTLPGEGEVVIEPEAGALSPDGTVTEGAWMVARAQAEAGMAFDHWVLYSPVSTLAASEPTISYQSVLRFRAGETRLSAVFRAVSGDAPALANLSLAAPGGRSLIGRTSQDTGFSSTEEVYDLSLLSQETELMLYGVRKRGTEAELQLVRDGIPLGTPIPLPDSLDSITADDPGALDTLTPLKLTGLADGDVLRVTVWSREDTQRKNMGVYQIYLHVAEHDPRMQAVFRQSEAAGPEIGGQLSARWELSLYLQNLQTEAAQLTLSIPRGSLYPLDDVGNPAVPEFKDGIADVTAYCQGDWNPRYRLSKAMLLRSPEANAPDKLTFIFEKAALESTPVYEPEPVRVVRLPFAAMEAGTNWIPGRAEVVAYDTSRLELELNIRVTHGGDITLTGVFTAWNPRQSYDPDDDTGEWRVYVLREGDPELFAPQSADTVVLADETEPEFGRRTFRFTFDKALEEGTYTLILKKPGHTTVTMEHLVLKKDEPQVDLNTLLAQALPETGGILSLFAGDVDGDGRISAFDKLELTDPARFGLTVDYEGATPDPDAGYDLDGDGRVTAFDLQILTEHYGRGPMRLTLPVADTAKGA